MGKGKDMGKGKGKGMDWGHQQQSWGQQQQSWGQQQQWQQPSGGVADEVGQAKNIRIAGCKQEVVGPIICGEYTMTQMNHGKPAYTKAAQGSNGFAVMIYFWDERDGAAASGWWIGP
eukprot:CAMPEP_0177500406 /NCGR_PEP_ID=MMETSP0369-20130122/36656_1 /TAXON_ID=447022 ORGANISM="Scrippsiella hangoei-like, Strain SHHI-4" /NCGR_SAMPLE_ID=MMETSP0369 /ASSEMBLY_ACC=CAM_ASM_000364 /LENGTH=116 /DNA_ID=CAMNT_0018977807 /DNA_START=6 /DNA_END=353 /DNA_ORIENTATION=+